MGMAKHIKMALLDKGITQKGLADMIGCPKQTVYNLLFRDNLTLKTAEKYADAIGCEIVLKDKESGKIY